MKKSIFIVGIVALGIVFLSGITFSYLSTGGKQSLANTFNSGCLSITIENESPALDLTGVYPVSDVEGLSGESYDFTIKNNCDEDTSYNISLESLDQKSNTLEADYIKVALSSDTMDNLISKLSETTSIEKTVDGAYASHLLYSGVIGKNESKEYHLKEWIDYDTTKEQGANKVYKSIINVTAGTNVENVQTSEIKFAYSGGSVTGTITGSAKNITYCETKKNMCEPKEEGIIEDSETTIPIKEFGTKTVTTRLGDLTVNTDSKGMVCAKLDNGKTICSNPDAGNGTPDFSITSEEADMSEKTCTYQGNPVADFESGPGAPISETGCKKIYKATMYGEIYYISDPLAKYETMIDQMLGPSIGDGEWDSENSICTYQGNQVLGAMDEQPITSEDKCGKVYNPEEGIYISMTAQDYLEMMGEGATSAEDMIKGMGAEDVEYVGAGIYKEAPGKTGIYETEDEEGTSYYYRGAVTNNYVEFANMYWRIIRINGNGSIRLIYSGNKNDITDDNKKEVLSNGYDDSDTHYTEIVLSAGEKGGPFSGSNLFGDNAYVGYMYGQIGASKYEDAHKNTNESNAKQALDKWYKINLQKYENQLDEETGFCNDRSLTTINMSGIPNTGRGADITYYGPFQRLEFNTKPTLKCPNKGNDYFTWKEHASTGNKALQYPVGLITADEVAFAGGVYQQNNTGYWLYTNSTYWTMSPYYFSRAYSYTFEVSSDGSISRMSVNLDFAFRPVINVDPTKVTITGKGTLDDMYIFT